MTRSLWTLAAFSFPALLGSGGFENFAGGARAMGLGEAGAAALPGAEALYWNPAALESPGAWTLAASQDSWAGGAGLAGLALASPTSAWGNFGALLQWGGWSGIEERDASGRLMGSFDLKSYSAAAAWSRALAPWLRLGLQATAADSLGRGAWGWGAGSGLYAEWGQAGLGLAVEREVSGLASAQASMKWGKEFGAWYLGGSLGAISADMDSRAGGGLEWGYDHFLFVRGGWQRPFSGSLQAVTYGGGLRFKELDLDYAAQVLGDLGTAHRVQAQTRFAAKAQPSPTAEPFPTVTQTPSPSPTLTPSPVVSPYSTLTVVPQISKTVEIKFIIPE